MSARLEGVILRKKILRDNDLLLHVFSPGDGRIKLLQKRGLKKPQAHLDLFCRNEFIVSENKDFGLIYQSSPLDLFRNIRQNYALLQAAAVLVKIVEQITSSLQPNAGLYQLLLANLSALNNTIDTAALPDIKLALYKNILLNEGIYDGKKITEKSFWQQIENYRG